MGWAASRASGDDWPQPEIKPIRLRINVVMISGARKVLFYRWEVANNIAICLGDYQLIGGAAKPLKDSERALLDPHSG